MADVLFVFVGEDRRRAEALADMFDAAGFAIGDLSETDKARAMVVIWSDVALRSRAFLSAAERAINEGSALIASLTTPPTAMRVGLTPTFDLSAWQGDTDDPIVDPLFFAVDRQVMTARMSAAAAQVPEPARGDADVIAWSSIADGAWESALPLLPAQRASVLRAEPADAIAPPAPEAVEITARYWPPPTERRRGGAPVLRSLTLAVLVAGAAFAANLSFVHPDQPASTESAVAAVPSASIEDVSLQLGEAEAAPIAEPTPQETILEPAARPVRRRAEAVPAPVRSWDPPVDPKREAFHHAIATGNYALIPAGLLDDEAAASEGDETIATNINTSAPPPAKTKPEARA